MRGLQNTPARGSRYQRGWEEVGQVLKKEEPASDMDDEQCPLYASALQELRYKHTSLLNHTFRIKSDSGMDDKSIVNPLF